MNSRPVAEHHDHAVPADAPLPQPVVSHSRWPLLLIWVVPLIAVAVTGWYSYRIFERRGPEITITFGDAENLKIRDTPLNFHGVRVGSVASIDLDDDRTHALVHVRLERAFADTVARNGTRFWLVRPDLGGGMLSGLSTVITGPYIDCLPGEGDPKFAFNGMDSRPVLIGDGVRVVLHTDRLSHLQVESPVYFRGMQVGEVQDIRFSADATEVNVTAFVWDRYRKLLRRGSRFWSVSGTDVQGGIFSGIKLQVNSVRALVAGAVAFATPDDGDAGPVPDGFNFTLHPEADKEWLTWSAKIKLPYDEAPAETPDNPNGPNALKKPD